ncbi:MAG: type II toxin-antitoxin system RelB/DinJ family antitoxin [Clostridiales bacterium]|nr:type II toxin-antitoxin system RelB/DinJ family antitoxin [Clostridiales bacterium]
MRARTDEGLKASAKTLLSRLGLTMTEAIALFLAWREMRRGLPFEARIPNGKTQRVHDEAHTGAWDK